MLLNLLIPKNKNDLYYLMNQDIPVMEFKLDTFGITYTRILNKPLLPEMLKIQEGRGLENWLRRRSVDFTRSNARLMLKQFNLGLDEIQVVIANRALTMTDTYWVKQVGEGILFDSVFLRNKPHNVKIAITSLSGARMDLIPDVNTELTNIGSYEKAWIRDIDGEWWLLKGGDNKSTYAELFTYNLAEVLGYPVAVYKYHEANTVASRNFITEDYILEHYHSLKFMFNNREMEEKTVYNNLKTVSGSIAEEYRNMLLLDALVCNIDRHEHNFGVIKSSNTGDIIRLAPNFDNNLAFGGPSSPNVQMLEDYIEGVGISKHQKGNLFKITLELLLKIDKKVKTEMSYKGNVLDFTKYFENIIRVLEGLV